MRMSLHFICQWKLAFRNKIGILRCALIKSQCSLHASDLSAIYLTIVRAQLMDIARIDLFKLHLEFLLNYSKTIIT